MTRVIIVDDDVDLVQSLMDYLKSMGIMVVGTGHDGKEAIALYEILKPDVIIIDIMMPKFDGFYAIDKIRQIDPYAKMIIVTGNFSQRLVIETYEPTVSLVEKPIKMKNLLDAINDMA